jgi:hypothetical protein
MVALETPVNEHSKNYLLGQKILASSVHPCTFKVRPMGQILLLSSCYIVNQENNNFRLHQFFDNTAVGCLEWNLVQFGKTLSRS